MVAAKICTSDNDTTSTFGEDVWARNKMVLKNLVRANLWELSLRSNEYQYLYIYIYLLYLLLAHEQRLNENSCRMTSCSDVMDLKVWDALELTGY